ncbi:MAG: hypothetical protein HYZ44_00675 [Bacteroidetes bacterium]|nr:hypothetical protein [Bacteroidota bacterium]
MEKQNDSGLPVNVAILATLISISLPFGVTYNPAKFSIKMEGLIALLARVKLALKALAIHPTKIEQPKNN